MMNLVLICCSALLCFMNCTNADAVVEEPLVKDVQNMEVEMPTAIAAEITSVTVSGAEGTYTFNVGIKSPDTGGEQYANWWEVITEDGRLVYRRILKHSHVSEQPFVRSGGGINIKANQVVIVRAHMNNSGYGTRVFKGSVIKGFVQDTVAEDFAKETANQDPFPVGCAF